MAGTSLGDVIDRARRRSFVGRRSELRAFDNAQAARSPRRVLFVHGPGGIGKTTLLLEMRARASAAGRTALFAASLTDPDLTRAYSAVASFIATPEEEGMTGPVRDQAVAVRARRRSRHWLPLDAPGKVNALLLEFLGQQGEIR